MLVVVLLLLIPLHALVEENEDYECDTKRDPARLSAALSLVASRFVLRSAQCYCQRLRIASVVWCLTSALVLVAFLGAIETLLVVITGPSYQAPCGEFDRSTSMVGKLREVTIVWFTKAKLAALKWNSHSREKPASIASGVKEAKHFVRFVVLVSLIVRSSPQGLR